mmetsp:Transcript_69992/g.203008  ORF Transcript_69992/g.203008 Transcript_69992/m.203008 type:complete len:240 (+) Transcript_69992:3046-3765(+)
MPMGERYLQRRAARQRLGLRVCSRHHELGDDTEVAVRACEVDRREASRVRDADWRAPADELQGGVPTPGRSHEQQPIAELLAVRRVEVAVWPLQRIAPEGPEVLALSPGGAHGSALRLQAQQAAVAMSVSGLPLRMQGHRHHDPTRLQPRPATALATASVGRRIVGEGLQRQKRLSADLSPSQLGPAAPPEDLILQHGFRPHSHRHLDVQPPRDKNRPLDLHPLPLQQCASDHLADQQV